MAAPVRRPGAGVAAVAAVLALLGGPLVAGATAAPTSGGISARTLPITAPVLDLTVPVAGLDGSSSTSRTGTTSRVTLASDVLFAFDRAEVDPSAAGRLAALAADLRDATGPVLVDGHTDGVGDPAYNSALSERRARAIADELARREPALVGRLRPAGHGAADPVAPNRKPDGSDDPAGRAENRRVTVTYVAPR